ncbi:MAG: tetratricopeptide repeat protein [Wenzhouxiangellaceae bacterium]
MAPLIVLLLTGAAPLQADEQRWLEVRTENFTVRTNVKRERALELAIDLEKYRFTIAYLSGLNTQGVPTVPVLVQAYRSDQQYLDATDAFGTAGFYVPRPSGAMSALSLEDGEEAWDLSGKRVLFHEYTHHILHQFSPLNYPRWYDEGFAEYMATMEFDDDVAVIGHLALHRAPMLKRVSDWLRAFEIIDSRGQYLSHIGSGTTRDPKRGKGGTAMQYAQGWLMVHFLHSKPELQQGIPRYLTAINRAHADDEAVFEAAFGMNYKQFDRALRRYWRDRDFRLGQVEIGSRMPPITPRVREISALEADALVDEFAILQGAEDQINARLARDRLRRCVDAGVRVREMRRALIELALIEGDWDAAERQIEALLDEHPDSAVGMTAKVRLARSVSDDDLDRERAHALREMIAEAIVSEPTYVPALMQYADLSFEHDLDIDDNVATVVDSIRFLAPALDEGKVFQARLLAHHGARDQAVELVDELIKWAQSDRQKVHYRELRASLAAN